jgi:peptide/nickel transport system substrate-binding protein
MSIPIAGIMGIAANASGATVHRLTIGFMQEVDSLNPYVGLNDASYVFYGLVYDALGVIDEDMNPVGDLAVGTWAVPESDPEMIEFGYPYGSVWQYNLTRNAQFTNREPFTAEDVKFNIELNAQYYDWMWAYQPYSFFMKEARIIDDYTVRVYFWDKASGDPMPAAYAYLVSIPMLPKHKLENMAPPDIGFTWTGLFPEEDIPIVSTGPFMATKDIYNEWLEGDHITLRKNPNYHWALDKVDVLGDPLDIDFDELILKFYEDATTMSYALQRKEIDVAAFPPQAYRSIYNSVQSGSLKNITTYHGPKVTQYWTEIGINMNAAGPNPSRLDIAIRQAMAMATDKDWIIENYYLGYADPGSTVIPPVNQYWHYEPNETELFHYNLTAANEMLEAAGYRDTNGDGIREAKLDSLAVQSGWVIADTPLRYEMLIRREYPEERDIAYYLQGEWADIGISLVVKIVDESELATIVYSYAYDTMIWYWSADIDPNYQLFVFTQASWYGWSDTKYYSEAYDTNYTLSVMTLDREDRKVYVDNCQRVFYRDAPYIVLAYAYQTYAWRNDTFTGWGDWGAHPGRTVDNFWMGNPLWFDLEPIVTDGGPTIPWWVFVAAFVAVVAVVVAVVILAKKGSKKKGKEEDSPIGD